MKKKKIIAYFLAAAIAMAAPFGLSAFAEDNVNPDPAAQTETTTSETTTAETTTESEETESDTESEATESTTESRASESTTESEEPESTTEEETEPPETEETTTGFLFTFPPEITTKPVVQIETTPPPPVVTTTKPAEIVIETEATTTTATTTSAAAPETVTEEETEPEETAVASTNGQGVTTMGSETALIAPVEGNEPGIPDVAEGDPGGDFITTIILIALGFVAFILVLTMPAIIKKIKRKIVYKY